MVQILGLIIWIGSWTIEGIYFFRFVKGANEYNRILLILVFNSVTLVANLLNFIIIAVVVYKSSKVIQLNHDPALKEDVSLLAYLRSQCIAQEKANVSSEQLLETEAPFFGIKSIETHKSKKSTTTLEIDSSESSDMHTTYKQNHSRSPTEVKSKDSKEAFYLGKDDLQLCEGLIGIYLKGNKSYTIKFRKGQQNSSRNSRNLLDDEILDLGSCK